MPTERAVPSGTVTFLFTDIEGSTRLWEGHRAEMEAALARHDEIVRSSVEGRGGYVFSTAGDAFSAAFATSSEAVRAAVDAQRRLQSETWPPDASIRVRMGLHVGSAHERDGDYFGTAVNRAARLMSLAHGGQAVVSEAVQQLVRDELPEGARLTPLGRHALRGLSEPETVLQICAPGLVDDFPPLASPSPGGNLPSPPTSFVGRVEQVKRLEAELVERRLVTLVGPGGVGKTRLAIEAAALAVDDYPDGVFLAELASVTDPSAVPHAVCTVLGTRPQEGMDPTAAVVDALAGRRVLLVLDNTEHVLSAATELSERVVSSRTRSTILATSREPLGTPGEQVWSVSPLDPSLEGVDLFCERATLADAAFQPDDADRALIEVVCRHLDGIPLAIELAAARLRSMTIADLAERLDDRFVLLRGPRRGGVERHQTLGAMIDWSYRLLDDAEAVLFDRLSVFAGAFDLAAAEAVCAHTPLERGEIFELLSGLAERSMLAAERGGTHVRWRMLETLRQYGAVRLAERGATAQFLDRHAAHFTMVAEAAHRAYSGRDAAAGVVAFEEAWDNLRVAFNRVVAAGDVVTARAILEASVWYCYFGLQAEHGDWVARARALAPEDPVLTGMAGMWAALEGNQRTAVAFGETAVAAAASPDALEGLFGWMAVTYGKFYSGQIDATAPAAADAAASRSSDLFVRAVVASFSCLGVFASDEVAGVAALTRACDLSAELHNGAASAFASYQSGNVHYQFGDRERAFLDYERALAEATAARVRMFELWSHTMLAARASEAGWPDAEARFAESLRYLGDNRIWSRAYGVLAALADHWVGVGELDQAAVLIGFLDEHDPVGLFLVAHQRARAAAGVAAHPNGRQCTARGRALDRHAVLEFALAELAHPS